MFKKKLNIKFYNMEDEKKIEKKVKSPKESSLILKKISELLTDICDENKKEKNLFYKPLKSFYSMNIPIISIKDYLEHLYKYTKISSSTIVLILIYIIIIIIKIPIITIIVTIGRKQIIIIFTE